MMSLKRIGRRVVIFKREIFSTGLGNGGWRLLRIVARGDAELMARSYCIDRPSHSHASPDRQALLALERGVMISFGIHPQAVRTHCLGTALSPLRSSVRIPPGCLLLEEAVRCRTDELAVSEVADAR